MYKGLSIILLRTGVNTCSSYGVPLYGKLEILDLDTLAGTLQLRVLGNQNCAYRDLGLGIPKAWTQAVGITDEIYHFLAISIGAVAGFCTVAGMALLIYRRRTVGPVFSATTPLPEVLAVLHARSEGALFAS